MLLCPGIMSLKYNEYKIMTVILNCNNKNISCVLLEFQLISIHKRTDVYKADVISASMGSVCFF